jgi:N-acetylneuraminate lyase
MKYVGMGCGEFRLPVKNMSVSDYGKFTEDARSLNMQELFSKI